MLRRGLFQRLHPDQIGALLVCLLSAPGVLLSSFLTIAKFRSEYRCDAWLLSACSFWDWFDCNRVLQSFWATPFYRLPISVYSTAYYLVLFGLGVAALSSSRRILPVVRPIILWMAWIGFSLIIFLGAYAYFVVGSACSYCLVIYGLTLAILLSATIMNPQGHRVGLAAMFEPKTARGGVVLLVTLVFLALVSAQMVQYRRGASRFELEQCATGGLLPESDVQSAARAPEVQISLFVDLACEHCKREYEVWRSLVAGQPEKYRLAIYHYARTGDCVPPDFRWYSGTAEKNYSCDAAQAVECVERELPDAGLRMVDALFALQGGEAPLFGPDRLVAAARQAGLTDLPDGPDALAHPFYKCLQGKKTVALASDHATFLMDQGILSTPVTYLTFFRKDGRPRPRMIMIKGAKHYNNLEKFLRAAQEAAEGNIAADKLPRTEE